MDLTMRVNKVYVLVLCVLAAVAGLYLGVWQLSVVGVGALVLVCVLDPALRAAVGVGGCWVLLVGALALAAFGALVAWAVGGAPWR